MQEGGTIKKLSLGTSDSETGCWRVWGVVSCRAVNRAVDVGGHLTKRWVGMDKGYGIVMGVVQRPHSAGAAVHLFLSPCGLFLT